MVKEKEIYLHINGYPICESSLKGVFAELLTHCVRADGVESVEAVREQLCQLVDIMQEYCKLKRQGSDSILDMKHRRRFRAEHTRFCTYLDGVRDNWNMILELGGLGLLRGFGMANKFGDSLRGDPERQSVTRGKVVG